MRRVSGLPQARVLHNRYHVLRPVGRGGMGAVYEAIDLRLQNTVAVKEMTATGAEADEAFRREARLLAGLRHFALPVVIDYFVQDAARFLVMQYIDGEDLGALFRRRGPFDEREVQAWAASILQALVFLHSHRPPIVHRDIKPSNIKLTPRGEVVLLDFGLAKGRIAGETRLAGDDVSIFGFTPNYAPLEQLEGRGTDPRSDLFALGATLFHLVTGGAPPDASTRAAALGAGQPDPVTSTFTSGRLSPAFGALLARAMQLQADQRFESAQAMLDALSAEPDRLRASARATPASDIRRIDAAAPSRAEVGRDIDLLVQVRFTVSPQLGLEDWPSKRRPAEIEQASDDVRVDHRRDAITGRELPARLRVKVVAPDFDIRGAAEHLIDVPSDDYSKRIGFLLAPKRAGHCRINVEVYSAADAVYLGAVPVETEALADAPAEALVQAGGLVLGVVAAAPETQANLSDTSRVPIAPPAPPPMPEPPKTHPPRVVVAQPVPYAAAPVPQMPAEPENDEALAAAIAERQRRLEQADEIEHERIKAQAARLASPPRTASARRRAAAAEAEAAGAPTASSPRRSNVAVWGLLAVVVIAGGSWWTVMRVDPGPVAGAPQIAMGNAADPIAPPPAAAAPPAPAPVPVPGPVPGAATLPATASVPPTRVQSSNRADVWLALESAARHGSILSVSLVVQNRSASAVSVSFEPAGTWIIAKDESKHALRHVPGTGTQTYPASAKGDVHLRLEFDVPPSVQGSFRLELGVPANDAALPRFPALPVEAN